VQLGGQLAGTQMGFGLVNLIDPQSNAHVTVIAEWQQLIALLVFLALDVHHVLLRALVESFHAAPPGAVALTAIGVQGAVALSGELFGLGVRIAAPVMIALLMSNGALGVLARTIPQLNVFVVGFPVHVGVGLVMLGASLPFTLRLLTARFGALEPILGGLVHGLAHG
jgi:flagellar biosynthetic protein FliR